jgi:beta-glucosidase
MSHTRDTILVLTFVGALIPMASASGQDIPPYLNTSYPLESRVRDLLDRMTLEEKAGQWVNSAPPVERLGIPAYDWWSECLHGVARAGYATVFPQAIGLAAMWDPSLMEQIGSAIGDEARAKHHEFVRRGERGIYQGLTFWSPNINLFRDPRWGRGMETFGEDPYLTGKTGAAFIRGLQGDDPRYLKLVGTMKHFAVHSGPEPERHTFDVVINERDLRESYLPHFRMCVREAHVQSVMCAYNRFQGDPCCGSNRLLAGILRDEWGFDGYVTSDCGAIGDIYKGHRVRRDAAEAAALAIRSGTDLNCSFDDAAPLEAVRRGLLKVEELDTAIARLFRARFQLGMFDPPEMVPYTSFPLSTVGSAQHRALALTAARNSIVLLKNEGVTLPLRKDLKSIAVIGPNANDDLSLLGNYFGTPEAPVTPLEGIRGILAPSVRVLFTSGCAFADGVPLLETIDPARLSHETGSAVASGLLAEFFPGKSAQGTPLLTRVDSSVDFSWCAALPLPGLDSTHFTVRWSGFLEPPATGTYSLGTFGFSGFVLSLDNDVVVSSEWGSETPIHARVRLSGGKRYRFRLEGVCRRSGSLVQLLWEIPRDDRLEEAVRLAQEADAVVLVMGLSPRVEGEEMKVDVPGFRGGDRTSIDLPAQQEHLLRAVAGIGKPVVLVLLNGSAVAIPWASEHIPAILECWYPGQGGGTALAEVLFGDVNPGGRLPVTFYRSVDDLPPFDHYAMEGRTYRFFDGEPLFPFGHGLSYTKFAYGAVRTNTDTLADSPGSACTVSVDVSNVGDRAGDEVVQLYIRPTASVIPRPRQDLRGFQRISLPPGRHQTVTFAVTPGDVATFDTATRSWKVEPGRYEILVGASSKDIRSRATITIR